jgi:tetratricopeptide (TPR) repeat protein
MTVLTILMLIIHSPTLLKQGDSSFAAQDYPGAMMLYADHLEHERDDAEGYWRLARAAICAGDMSSGLEQEALYRKALRASIRAVTIDSLNSNAQCWYAVSLGYIALFEGSRTKVEYCRKIQRSLERAIVLDPANDVPYSVLGTFYRMLANVSWLERQLADLLLGGLPEGGLSDAERMLRRATELAPQIIRHRYELGLVYDAQGRRSEAVRQFREALAIPPTLASDGQRIEEMKQRLRQ